MLLVPAAPGTACATCNEPAKYAIALPMFTFYECEACLKAFHEQVKTACPIVTA